MSGPKMSRAEIERQKREALERERRRKLALIAEINDRSEEIRSLTAELQAIRDTMNLSVGDRDAKDSISRAISSMGSIRRASAEDDLDQLYEKSGEMLRQARRIVEDVRRKAQVWTERSEAGRRQESRSAGAIRAAAALDSIAKESEIIQRNVSFVSHEDRERQKAFLTSLREYAKSLTRSGDKRLAEIGNGALSALAPLLSLGDLTPHRDGLTLMGERMTNLVQDRLREIRETDALYRQYAALAVLGGRNPSPRDAFSDPGELQKQAEELENLIRQQDEMDYIADQINDVMLELGYTFVSSRAVARQGRDGDHSLYQADEDTGISVYTDADGTVTMWVTNLTDTDAPISDADREFSYQRQLDFCAGHQDIVEALKKRGIRLRAKRYERADRKFTQKAVVPRNQRSKKKKENRGKRRNGRNVSRVLQAAD